MKTGTVKFFNATKGFGFIVEDETNTEYFVHFSAIETDGYKTLTDGQKVTFGVEIDEKGPKAVKVKPVEGSITSINGAQSSMPKAA